MISSWAALLFAAIAIAALGVGLYLLAWHRGYLAGSADHRFDKLPVDPPWTPPPSEGEFLSELLERERQNEPPRKYQREK
jgi:hypothetical protein